MDNGNGTPEQKAKPTCDPGWNDPPQFYNAQQPTTSRPRNFLNKRVAFPLTNASTSSSPAAPMNLPPMPVAGYRPPPLPPRLIETPEKAIDADSEDLMNRVKDILYQLLDNYSELGSKANDIKRRLDVMEDMWLDGKLENLIQLHMMELVCALRDNHPIKADDIHRALLIQFASSVSPWMPGIKQLIRHSIARYELMALDREQLDIDED